MKHDEYLGVSNIIYRLTQKVDERHYEKQDGVGENGLGNCKQRFMVYLFCN